MHVNITSIVKKIEHASKKRFCADTKIKLKKNQNNFILQSRICNFNSSDTIFNLFFLFKYLLVLYNTLLFYKLPYALNKIGQMNGQLAAIKKKKGLPGSPFIYLIIKIYAIWHVFISYCGDFYEKKIVNLRNLTQFIASLSKFTEIYEVKLSKFR